MKSLIIMLQFTNSQKLASSTYSRGLVCFILNSHLYRVKNLDLLQLKDFFLDFVKIWIQKSSRRYWPAKKNLRSQHDPRGTTLAWGNYIGEWVNAWNSLIYSIIVSKLLKLSVFWDSGSMHHFQQKLTNWARGSIQPWTWG